MQTRIRIIKRGEDRSTSSPSPNQVERTARQSERETATTVKSWIAEWEARNRAVKAAAFSLVRSLENRSFCEKISVVVPRDLGEITKNSLIVSHESSVVFVGTPVALRGCGGTRR